MHDTNEELPSRIGIALFVATLLALAAIAAAEAFGFAFFEDQPIPEAIDRHAHIYAGIVQCMNEPSVITVNGVPVADCRPRKQK